MSSTQMKLRAERAHASEDRFNLMDVAELANFGFTSVWNVKHGSIH